MAANEHVINNYPWLHTVISVSLVDNPEIFSEDYMKNHYLIETGLSMDTISKNLYLKKIKLMSKRIFHLCTVKERWNLYSVLFEYTFNPHIDLKRKWK